MRFEMLSRAQCPVLAYTLPHVDEMRHDNAAIIQFNLDLTRLAGNDAIRSSGGPTIDNPGARIMRAVPPPDFSFDQDDGSLFKFVPSLRLSPDTDKSENLATR
ncbi:MAG: hypothetical protein QGI88_01785 [SAR202 cluster bacterium]|nr:hypothetical protein [SAR202 cluster bacterium]